MKAPPGDVTYEDVQGGDGGRAEATIDVSDIDQLEIYVGGTGGEAIGEDHTVAGWGWKEGGNGHGDGGAGGSSSAIVVDGNPVLIADGGGGGTSWDTYTWGSGGGGARGGKSYGNNWGNSGEDGKGAGYGGDGAYGDDPSAEALVPAEDGRGEIINGSIVSEEVITEGAGGKDGEHGYISIEWVTEETIKRSIPAE